MDEGRVLNLLKLEKDVDIWLPSTQHGESCCERLSKGLH